MGLWDDVVQEIETPEKEEDKRYTIKVNVPQYLPSDKKPNVYELFNVKKYTELLDNINKAMLEGKITPDERNFLIYSASRHIVFDYAKIADYYAHSSPDVQRLMEESGLVIVDFDDAIANGYVKLSNRLKKIMTETGRFASENYANQKTGKKNER